MNKGLIANASTTINAPSADLWQALVTPAAIKEYMFGTTVTSDWVVGSPIVWKGEWQGRAYEDKGIILQVVPERVLEYSHFSPLTGVPDVPENYHIVTVELSPDGERTRVTLSQDNNPTEQAREHSEKNWGMMLAALKQFLERQP
jgi:uncharacterized protein YndB with AHSA1/START domain